MKRPLHLLFIIFLLLFNISNVAARNKAVDSLKAAIENYRGHDTAKALLILNLANEYNNSNADTMIILGNEAMAIAKEKKHDRLVAKTLELFGMAHFFKGDLDSAKWYYSRSIEYCKRLGIPLNLASNYNNIGNIYLRKSEFPRALTYYDSCIDIARPNNFAEALGRALSNTASVYYKVGNYVTALEFYLEGLKVHEKLNSAADIETSLLNLANVQFRLNNYEKALIYADRAMEYAKKSRSKWSVISNLTTHAMIYNKQKRHDSALIQLNNALLMAKEMNNAYLINLLNTNIAECYYHSKKYRPALRLYKKAITNSAQIGDKEGEAIAQAGVGQILFEQKQYILGKQYMVDALKTMQGLGQKQQVIDISEQLTAAYEAIGDHKEALKYSRIKEAYSDSMSKREAAQEAEKLQYQYELDKKDSEIELLAKERELEKARLQESRIMLIAAIIGLALALVAIYYFFTNLTNIKRSNKLVREQKHEIFQQAKKLEELNNFKDTTFSVLSHDLRSPINALTGTLSLLDEGVISPEEFIAFKPELNNKLQSVTLMLDNLLYWAQMQMKGGDGIAKQKIDLSKIVQTVADTLDDASNQKNLSLSNNISKGTMIYGDPNQIEMVLRNIISNSVKFTPNNGTVTLSSEIEGFFTKISISDTGVGMSAKKAASLFSEKGNKSTLGTSGEKGTGIGMMLSYSFIKKHGGEIKVSSTEGEGTTFTIFIPNKD